MSRLRRTVIKVRVQLQLLARVCRQQHRRWHAPTPTLLLLLHRHHHHQVCANSDFELVVLMMIFGNCISLAAYNPLEPPHGPRNGLLTKIGEQQRTAVRGCRMTAARASLMCHAAAVGSMPAATPTCASRRSVAHTHARNIAQTWR